MPDIVPSRLILVFVPRFMLDLQESSARVAVHGSGMFLSPWPVRLPPLITVHAYTDVFEMSSLTFTLNIFRCPLPTGGPNESLALLEAFHMRREFKVDMSEFVYSFARGILNIKCQPED